MKSFTRLLTFLLLLMLLVPVHAHANLLRSEPAANTASKTAPEEIRLWFSEPLEDGFSTIELRDSDGERVPTGKTIIDPSDDKQLVLPLETLPEGLYTVSWRALSKTDGHLTQGSFPMAVGAAYLNNVSMSSQAETIPADSAAIRWFNLLSLALFTGSIGFVLFVWQPVMGKSRKTAPVSPPDARSMVENEISLSRLIGLGWLLAGLATGLILLLQVAIALSDTLWAALTSPLLLSMMTDTRFGTLWILRVGLWVCAGGILLFWQRDMLRDRVLFLLSIGMIATQSLFSHASSVPEPAPAIVADFLHTLTMALWVGGLIAFLRVIWQLHVVSSSEIHPDTNPPPLHREGSQITTLSLLTAYFSNYMRVTIAALMLTGVYAAWLQVGSVNALLTTLYGQALLVKLLLILPLLAIAAVNLFLTGRGLQAGKAIWTRRLRGLVALEVVLTISILGAVGVMTAISPARGITALRDATAAAPVPSHFMETQTAEGLELTLHIVPGWVGENTFALVINDENGTAVEDASRVRLQFDYQPEDLGRSELRPEHSNLGIYQIDGANLTAPGLWRVRVIVARPGAYDAVVDFMPDVPPAPLPPSPADVALYPETVPYGVLSLLLGIVGIGTSLVFLRWNHANGGVRIVSVIWLIGSLLMVFVSIPSLSPPPVAVVEEAAFPSDTPIKLAISSRVDLPALVTQGGTLLLPDERGIWQAVALDAKIETIFMEENGGLWAATHQGVYQYAADTWEKRTDVPVEHLTLMHGFIFASGDAGMTRTEWGGTYSTRRLEMPAAGAAEELVMLGNHDHILRVGNRVFSTPDLGLSWEALADAPPNIIYISVTSEGNLFASTLDAVYVWNYVEKTWRELPTPPKMPVTEAKIFNDRLYIIADGQLYQRQSDSWVLAGDEQATYTALAVQYQHGLWALDAAHQRLWFTADGTTWDAVEIRTGDS